MPRRGTKQVIKTTVTPDRRAQLREALQQYQKGRPDLSSGSPAGQIGYQAPRGLGRKMPQPRTRVAQAGAQAAQAQAGKATPPPQAAGGAGVPPKKPRKPKPAKPQGLGSPGHVPAYVKDIGTYQQANLSQSTKDIEEHQPDFHAGTDLPENRPQYGINPPTIKGEALKDYDARYAAAIDAYEARKQGGTP